MSHSVAQREGRVRSFLPQVVVLLGPVIGVRAARYSAVGVEGDREAWG